MVCSVIHEVIHNISALITMWIRPSVRMYSGIEMICTIGLMIALTNPKITATTKMIPTFCRVVSPPTNVDAGNDQGNYPQSESGHCCAQQKCHHAADDANRMCTHGEKHAEISPPVHTRRSATCPYRLRSR